MLKKVFDIIINRIYISLQNYDIYGVQTTRAIENFHISGNLSWDINAVNTSSARPTMW